MTSLQKSSTLLGGVPVCRDPVKKLTVLYERILTICKTMPKEAAYRKYTENIVNDRLKTITTAPDQLFIENKYKVQVEEMIYQANNEIVTARKMAEYKVWEPLEKKPPAGQWKWPAY